MKRRTPAIVSAAIAIVASCALAGAAEADDKSEAIAAAEAWLALVDNAQYGQSWKEAASLFKGAVSESKWEEQMKGGRAPLGALTSRTVKKADYYTSLPGAPDGEYVVIQFQTSFANKSSAVETVTPMKDDDGRWRVSGYFIK